MSSRLALGLDVTTVELCDVLDVPAHRLYRWADAMGFDVSWKGKRKWWSSTEQWGMAVMATLSHWFLPAKAAEIADLAVALEQRTGWLFVSGEEFAVVERPLDFWQIVPGRGRFGDVVVVLCLDAIAERYGLADRLTPVFVNVPTGAYL